MTSITECLREPLIYSSRYMFLLQGGAWEGDGLFVRTKTIGYLTRRVQTHPHPNPHLEGEGMNLRFLRETLYSSPRCRPGPSRLLRLDSGIRRNDDKRINRRTPR
jgi:hypothetical protein